jgi:8-oxo-dGTP diphosphatase
VLASLALPVEYAITNAAQFGTTQMLARLERRLEQGLKLLQVREPGLAGEERRLFTQQALSLAHRYGCRVLVKSLLSGADGVHFTAAELMRLQERPTEVLAAASCHSREELERAMQLELDFAVLGPVKRTASHAAEPVLGWKGFATIARGASLPVYAIGGLARADLEEAWRAGAHGLAMISGSWR